MDINDKEYRLRIAQENFDKAKQQESELERAAKRLAHTGSQRDLRRYLKLRRNAL